MSNKKKETDEVKELRAFKEERQLSYDKLGHALGVHSMTIFNWFRRYREPSDMAKRVIAAFLKEEKRKEQEE